MGYGKDRENLRVAEGERIARIIADALRMRDPAILHPDDRETNQPYRETMLDLLDVFEQIARDQIERREIDLSYDG